MATSNFQIYLETTAGAKVTTGTVELQPYDSAYDTGALELTHQGDGVWTRAAVPDGEYSLYYDGTVLTNYQRFWIGEDRLSTIADHFDSADSYKLKATGAKADEFLVLDFPCFKPNYTDAKGYPTITAARKNIYGAIKSLRLYGAKQTGQYLIRSFTKDASGNHKVILCRQYLDVYYRDIIDNTTNGITYTDNANGTTRITIDAYDNDKTQEGTPPATPYGSPSLRLVMDIDLRDISDETYTLETSNTGGATHLIKQKCLFPNITEQYTCFERYITRNVNDSTETSVMKGDPRDIALGANDITEDLTLHDFYSSIKKIHLYGAETTYYYKFALIARNNTGNSNGYRFIIYRKPKAGGAWATWLDSTSSISVTEATPLKTTVTYTSGSRRCDFDIDYSIIPWGWGDVVDGSLTADPMFIINQDLVHSETYANYAKDNFLNLLDTPSSYSSNALKVARVNAGETAIEFATPTSAADQSLNTTDDVEFNSVTAGAVSVSGSLPTGTLASPPGGISIGDFWLDTTDSATHPILRQKVA